MRRAQKKKLVSSQETSGNKTFLRWGQKLYCQLALFILSANIFYCLLWDTSCYVDEISVWIAGAWERCHKEKRSDQCCPNANVHINHGELVKIQIYIE